MICKNCGAEIADNSKFCGECGAVIKSKAAESAKIEGKKVTENIYLCPDGKYRWVYEYAMLKNPVILFTVCKVLVISLLIVAAFVTLLNLINGNPIFVAPSEMERKGLTVTAIVLVFCVLIAYFVVAKSKGFKYCVLFEMDEDWVVHKELPQSYKKTQALSELVFIAGLAANRPGVAGSGLLAASKSSQASEFGRVKRMKVLKAFHTIKLDYPMSHNQVYAEPEDFDFLKEYIEKRVKKN